MNIEDKAIAIMARLENEFFKGKYSSSGLESIEKIIKDGLTTFESQIRESERSRIHIELMEAEKNILLETVQDLKEYANQSGNNVIDIEHLCEVLLSHETLTNNVTEKEV